MKPRNWVVAVIVVVLIVAFLALARGRVRTDTVETESGRTARWERVV